MTVLSEHVEPSVVSFRTARDGDTSDQSKGLTIHRLEAEIADRPSLLAYGETRSLLSVDEFSPNVERGDDVQSCANMPKARVSATGSLSTEDRRKRRTSFRFILKGKMVGVNQLRSLLEKFPSPEDLSVPFLGGMEDGECHRVQAVSTT